VFIFVNGLVRWLRRCQPKGYRSHLPVLDSRESTRSTCFPLHPRVKFLVTLQLKLTPGILVELLAWRHRKPTTIRYPKPPASLHLNFLAKRLFMLVNVPALWQSLTLSKLARTLSSNHATARARSTERLMQIPLARTIATPFLARRPFLRHARCTLGKGIMWRRRPRIPHTNIRPLYPLGINLVSPFHSRGDVY
jgi:hypothetical protein